MSTMSAEAQSCRLCDESNEQMLHVFDANEFDVKIIRLIQDCLPILIYEDDPLSKYICRSCNENLNMFADFKKTCIDISRKHQIELEKATGDPNVQQYLNKVKEFEEIDPMDSRNGHHLDNSMTDMELDSMDDASQTSHTTQESHSQNGDFDGRCMLAFSPKIHKKPRISGPRSKTDTYKKIVKTQEIFYQPLTLKELVVQRINIQNVTDFDASFSHEDVTANESITYCCRYCDEQFEEETDLAMHELQVHIQLHLQRVDSGGMWDETQEEYNLRNRWMEENREDDLLSVGQEELLIPISEEKTNGKGNKSEDDGEVPTLDVSRDSKIYFEGDIAYLNGVPLSDVPKEERNTYYQSVLYNGARRKFCQLCRFLFRDNWSIDMHYLQSSCVYSCHYCGQKFKRNRSEMPEHNQLHEEAGHKKCTNVYIHDKYGQLKEVSTSTLSPYQPTLSWIYQRNKNSASPSSSSDGKTSQKETKSPCAKLAPSGPTPMKLRERTSLPAPPTYDDYDDYERKPVFIAPKPKPPTVTVKREVNGTTDVKNQAYFCKKCYQVFTKLGNYNIHVSKCTGDAAPSSIGKTTQNLRKSTGSMTGTTKKALPALTPLMIPVAKIKQEVIKEGVDPPPLDFPCSHCNAVFPTIYSRNSHMRVHVWAKSGHKPSKAAEKRAAPSQQQVFPAKRIKSESNFEPIVEIHEGATTTIGSVSITPLRKTISGVRPDVMKLVQNNPNISFKPRAPVPIAPKPTPAPPAKVTDPQPLPPPEEGDVKGGYKCASCHQYFANKSNLYFHKKNQCTGSRFPCPFCKKRFGTASEYSSHIFYSHPE